MRKTVPSATSVEDECRMMGQCRCGGDWKLTANEVTLRRSTWVDYVAVRCDQCSFRTAFEFDVSGFFEPRPGVWGGRLPSRHRGLAHIAQRARRTRAASPVYAAA
jgi:hypothetical protein